MVGGQSVCIVQPTETEQFTWFLRPTCSMFPPCAASCAAAWLSCLARDSKFLCSFLLVPPLCSQLYSGMAELVGLPPGGGAPEDRLLLTQFNLSSGDSAVYSDLKVGAGICICMFVFVEFAPSSTCPPPQRCTATRRWAGQLHWAWQLH